MLRIFSITDTRTPVCVNIASSHWVVSGTKLPDIFLLLLLVRWCYRHFRSLTIYTTSWLNNTAAKFISADKSHCNETRISESGKEVKNMAIVLLESLFPSYCLPYLKAFMMLAKIFGVRRKNSVSGRHQEELCCVEDVVEVEWSLRGVNSAGCFPLSDWCRR